MIWKKIARFDTHDFRDFIQIIETRLKKNSEEFAHDLFVEDETSKNFITSLRGMVTIPKQELGSVGTSTYRISVAQNADL